MAQTDEKIKLIVATTVAAADEEEDRGGGETHSLRSFFGGTVAKVVEIDPNKLRADIDKCLGQMKQVFADLKRPPLMAGKWSISMSA